mgnify:CR=1 FL=1
MVRRTLVRLAGIWPWLALCLLLPSLGACVLDEGELSMVWGNYAYSRGEYQDATIKYLQAYEKDQASRPWALYNLGNVYYSLGELESALARWEEAAKANPDRDLSFAIQFNRGIAAYNQGRYADSFSLFREALLIRPASLETKINLELSQRKLQVSDRPAESASIPNTPAGVPGSAMLDRTRLLDFVENQESQRWKAGQADGVLPRGNDW